MKTRKKYKIKSKERFSIFIVSLLLISFISVGTFSGLLNTIGHAESSYIEVEIMQGDTLWDLAANHISEDTDIRDAIARIQSINNISNGELKVGQVISIPGDL